MRVLNCTRVNLHVVYLRKACSPSPPVQQLVCAPACIFVCVSLCVCVCVCVCCAPPLPQKNELQGYSQRRLLNVTNSTLAVALTIYMLVAVSGCLLFGAGTQDDVRACDCS